jgi:hypothetical protein
MHTILQASFIYLACLILKTGVLAIIWQRPSSELPRAFDA